MSIRRTTSPGFYLSKVSHADQRLNSPYLLPLSAWHFLKIFGNYPSTSFFLSGLPFPRPPDRTHFQAPLHQLTSPLAQPSPWRRYSVVLVLLEYLLARSLCYEFPVALLSAIFLLSHETTRQFQGNLFSPCLLRVDFYLVLLPSGRHLATSFP